MIKVSADWLAAELPSKVTPLLVGWSQSIRRLTHDYK